MKRKLMAKFDVTKIAEYLNKYKDQLDEVYDWKSNFQRLVEIDVIGEAELAELRSSNLSHFQRDEKLKDILSKALRDCEHDRDQFEKIALWIIRDWGGIHNGSDIDTIKRVNEFFSANKPSFDRIASASKVGALRFPDKFIIYDSRVAYAMNWILLSEDAGDKFFPIPDGRNSKMQAFNLNVLIRLKFPHIYRPDKAEAWKKGTHISLRDKELYIPKPDAYHELNDLVGKVNAVLWHDRRKHQRFYTEMLLFALADKGIFREITERVSINIE